MRRAWAKLLFVTITACLMCAGQACAQNYERMSDVEADQYSDFALVQGDDYQTMKNVRRYWVQEAQRLKSMKQLEFVLTGSNEGLLKVTIPSRLLFAHNDSVMLNSADGVLRPLLRLAKGSNSNTAARIIVAGYTDNNGSEAYLTRLSGGRARQVHRWFARQGIGPSDIRSFGFGNKVQRTDNSSIAKREKNRRISIYFVPTRKMLKAAKKGDL